MIIKSAAKVFKKEPSDMYYQKSVASYRADL
ncbi:hypothetical protein Pvag_1780 [Pantoea vagans C9-1]|nr:hypothetical protein Pvag_1780 [Pantoea vagans C9-1]